MIVVSRVSVIGAKCLNVREISNGHDAMVVPENAANVLLSLGTKSGTK